MALLDEHAVIEALNDVAWGRDGNEIRKIVKLDDFAAALRFVNEVGALAEKMNHHPDIDIRWNTVTLTLSSHSEGGLTENDFTLAAQIDAIDH